MTNADSTARPPVRKLFPLVVLALGTTLFLGAHFWPNTNISSSNMSLLKMLAIISTLVALTVWWVRLPRWSLRNRLLVVTGCAGLLLSVFKPTSMDGQFFMMFGPRDWVQNLLLGGTHDVLLARQRAEQGLAETSGSLKANPTDMAEFRGPARDGVVVGPAILREWNSTPPTEEWRQLVGGGYAGFVVANGQLVTIEQRRDEEVVVCYEARTGREVWSRAWSARFSETAGGDGPRATPTIARGDVFAYGATGRLVCLNGTDGTEKWAVDTLQNNKNQRWGMSGSPLIVGDLVIVNPGAQTEASKGRAILAYDIATGKEQWASGDYPGSYCSPQLSKLHDQDTLLIFDGHGLAGYDPKNGKQRWRTPWKTDFEINVAQPIVMDHETICIGSGYNHGGAKIRIKKDGEAWSAETVWTTKNTVMRWKFASGVRLKDNTGDYLYGLNDGLLECVDARTGKPMWKDERRAKRGEGYGHGQLLLSGDRLVILTEYGELVLVEATSEAFREVGRVQALTKGQKTWNTPVMADGKIYIRNEMEMACYNLQAR